MKMILAILVMASLILGGCAATSHIEKTNSADIEKKIDLLDQAKLMQANKSLDEENPEAALWIYEELLQKKDLFSAQIRSGLLTNAALASLEQADREKFMSYAEELRNESRKLYRLPKNTQFILLVADEFSGKTTERDLRVSSNLAQVVSTVIQEK